MSAEQTSALSAILYFYEPNIDYKREVVMYKELLLFATVIISYFLWMEAWSRRNSRNLEKKLRETSFLLLL
jgi:hypothetical protein